MIDDARWQYQQSVDNAYEDWHPVLMAWVWRRLMFIQPGPAPMLVLQLALYWGGIALVASWAYRRGRTGLAVALALVGWIPAPLTLTGTIIKDCLMAGLLCCATGLLLWRDFIRSGAGRGALSAAAICALLLAAALRFNAFLACVPLALVAVPLSFTRTWPRRLVTVLAATAAFIAVGPALATLVNAEKTDVTLSLIIFDLGGITEHSGVSQFPDMQIADAVAVNRRCYDPYEWDSYSSWAKTPCPIGFERLESMVDDEDFDASAAWLHAVLSHPLAYAEHRLTHFNLSTWFLVPKGPDFTAWSQSVANPWNFRVRPNPLLTALTALADAAALTPLGWPIFWISLALAALIAAVSARLRPEVQAVAASSFLYGLGYVVFGVATGMRYYVWTITGAGLAAVLVAGELWGRRGGLPRRALLLGTAVVMLPTVLGTVARIAS
ncbi:MAG: hypothetical protein ACJ8FT_05645 [Sphingomonas sp.]